MREIPVGPDDDVQAALDRARPGDVVLLRAGIYGRKFRLGGRRGTAAEPIVLRGEPGAVLDGGLRFERFNPRAMEFILRRMDADEEKPREVPRYPGLHDWLLPEVELDDVCDDERRPGLAIEGCAHVRVEGLAIRGHWPAAIAVRDSPGVTLSSLAIEEATYAIHARGRATRGLVVESTSWVQDLTRRRLWFGTPWQRMHDGDVGQADARAFDGDFLQGVDLGPGLVVRGCLVEHAFNGVHLWNKGRDPGLCTDVLIHDNRFRFVRDNIVEPELAARRWWIYRNRFENCHKWLSFEVREGGHFYVFGNLGWFDALPGPPDDAHRGGGVLKVQKKAPEGTGPWHLFHNSFLLRGSYVRAGRLRGLRHRNNALHYARPGEVAVDPAFLERPFFGLHAYRNDDSEIGDDYQVRERFTTRWHELGIEFAGDVIRHPDVPAALVEAGYPGDLFRVRGEEPFAAAGPGEAGLRPGLACFGRAAGLEVELWDGRTLRRPAGADVGAFQSDGLFAWPELERAGREAVEAALDDVPVA